MTPVYANFGKLRLQRHAPGACFHKAAPFPRIKNENNNNNNNQAVCLALMHCILRRHPPAQAEAPRAVPAGCAPHSPTQQLHHLAAGDCAPCRLLFRVLLVSRYVSIGEQGLRQQLHARHSNPHQPGIQRR